MAIELCILASGSSGNSTIVRCPGGTILIDIGIGPRTTAKRLEGTGVAVASIAAICLTHLDRDHFNPNWISTIVRHGIRIFCHRGKAAGLLRLAAGATDAPRLRDLESLVHPFDGVPFEPLPGLAAHTAELAHDQAGSHAFCLAGFGCRVGYATDLGRVPPRLLELFRDLDLLALESNYDPRMEMASPRPMSLKQRIMGGSGHLSNEQALNAVRSILDRAQADGHRLPAHIVLLHRSRECNCPRVVRELFAQDPRIAARLVLAEQSKPTGWLRAVRGAAGPGEQLTLAWRSEI